MILDRDLTQIFCLNGVQDRKQYFAALVEFFLEKAKTSPQNIAIDKCFKIVDELSNISTRDEIFRRTNFVKYLRHPEKYSRELDTVLSLTQYLNGKVHSSKIDVRSPYLIEGSNLVIRPSNDEVTVTWDGEGSSILVADDLCRGKFDRALTFECETSGQSICMEEMNEIIFPSSGVNQRIFNFQENELLNQYRDKILDNVRYIIFTNNFLSESATFPNYSRGFISINPRENALRGQNQNDWIWHGIIHEASHWDFLDVIDPIMEQNNLLFCKNRSLSEKKHIAPWKSGVEYRNVRQFIFAIHGFCGGLSYLLDCLLKRDEINRYTYDRVDGDLRGISGAFSVLNAIEDQLSDFGLCVKKFLFAEFETKILVKFYKLRNIIAENQ